MVLKEFISQLMESGHVTVSSDPVLQPLEEVGTLLQEMDLLHRANLAFEAPPFEPDAGYWALTQLYRGAQFLVCRHLGEEELQRAFRQSNPGPTCHAVIYSVDLFFQYLPDLIKLAKNTSAGDPLVKVLNRLAGDWTLSGVGAGLPGPYAVKPFVENPCLLQLYVDRVLQYQELDRLQDPQVALLAHRSLGPHAQLNPEAADYLKAKHVLISY
jgi:hypothetical protein